MGRIIRIGTRESQLAVWQTTQVKKLLEEQGFATELVYIKSEGDTDLKTPLYEMGVQGIFTRALDVALLNNKIDLAVHSMKDVPVRLPVGMSQAAVLKRASHKDLLVYKENQELLKAIGFSGDGWAPVEQPPRASFLIATSSIRRKAQWLNRYPAHTITNLRGNVNTRLQKLMDSEWDGAIFAAAGLERINLRPENSIELDWMLPAPAQGAIIVTARENDNYSVDACKAFHDDLTAICTKIERDFLKTLMGGCSTPISGLAEIKDNKIIFMGNILSIDGIKKAGIKLERNINESADLGTVAAREILVNGGKEIVESFAK